MVVGENLAMLREAVTRNSSAAMVVLDMAGVKRIDAGGLGVLLGLRQWTETRAIRFKLMNVMPEVDRILRLTKLDCVFEFCSVREMLCLLLLAHTPMVAEPRDFGMNRNAAFCDPPAA
jgi:anti-anti-sigma factor